MSLKNLFTCVAVLFACFFASDVLAALPTVGSDGGDIATNTSSLFKKYASYIVYGSGAIVFVIASFWIIGAISDWRAQKPGASIGNVLVTIFIAILATVFVMYLLTQGLDILDANF